VAELESIIGSIMSSPESLGRILEVAKLFGGEEKREPAPEEKKDVLPIGGDMNGISPELVSKVMMLLGEYNTDDRRIHLLGAIRPYLSDDDGFHIDRAIRIVKLSHVAKSAFENFLK
jgi:hypothetical protein